MSCAGGDASDIIGASPLNYSGLPLPLLPTRTDNGDADGEMIRHSGRREC